MSRTTPQDTDDEHRRKHDALEAKARRHMDVTVDMLNGPLLKSILLFAIPLALTSILQQLLNSADASIAGRYIGASALAGIGGTSPITSMFVNLFAGMSIGANVVIAICIGNRQTNRIETAIHTAMALSVVVGVALCAAGLLLSGWIIDSIGMPADARADGLLYMQLYFGAIPFMTAYNFASAVLRAHGDSRRPLYALAAAAVANIALNLLFVREFGWGTAGIGVATIISFGIGAALVTLFMLREHEPFAFHPRKLCLNRNDLKHILLIGVPAGVQGAVFSLSNIVVQAAINGFGSAAIAGSSATINFEYYTFFFVSAFAQTAVTFTGQNYAARNVERCRKIYRMCLLLGFSSALVMGVTFTALGERALSVFTTDAAALGYGTIRMWLVELPDCLASLYEIPAGAMRGMGWSTLPAVITIIGSFVLRVAFVILVYPSIGTFTSLMALYPATWACMIVAMQIAFSLVRKRAYEKAQASEGC